MGEKWSATYTIQFNQKREVFEDGVLELHSLNGTDKVMLYDAGGKVLATKVLKKNELLGSGETLTLDGYVVDIGDLDRNCNCDPLCKLHLIDQPKRSRMTTEIANEDCLAWAARDPSGVLSPYKFSRRVLGPDDVSLTITHCGVCQADVIWARNEFHDTVYPLVPGHEIVGTVKEVGSNVTVFKAGDHVRVGTYVNSCRECEYCNEGQEVHCEKVGVKRRHGTTNIVFIFPLGVIIASDRRLSDDEGLVLLQEMDKINEFLQTTGDTLIYTTCGGIEEHLYVQQKLKKVVEVAQEGEFLAFDEVAEKIRSTFVEAGEVLEKVAVDSLIIGFDYSHKFKFYHVDYRRTKEGIVTDLSTEVQHLPGKKFILTCGTGGDSAKRVIEQITFNADTTIEEARFHALKALSEAMIHDEFTGAGATIGFLSPEGVYDQINYSALDIYQKFFERFSENSLVVVSRVHGEKFEMRFKHCFGKTLRRTMIKKPQFTAYRVTFPSPWLLEKCFLRVGEVKPFEIKPSSFLDRGIYWPADNPFYVSRFSNEILESIFYSGPWY